MESEALSPDIERSTNSHDHPEKSLIKQVEDRVYDTLHPEVQRLRRSLPWIDELNLPQKALEWMGQCRDLDEKEKSIDNSRNVKTAFELVKVHLLMLREQKLIASGDVANHKREFMRKELDRELDELLSYITEGGQKTGGFNKETVELYHKATTVEEKSTVLTRFMLSWHSGRDTNFCLDRFRGFPSIINNIGGDYHIFLHRLENYDRPQYWKKEAKRYEKSLRSGIRAYSYRPRPVH